MSQCVPFHSGTYPHGSRHRGPVGEKLPPGGEYRKGVSVFARRLQQRALDEIRKQTTMLVGDLYVAPVAPVVTAAAHDANCQMAASGRLDPACGRCRAILNITEP